MPTSVFTYTLEQVFIFWCLIIWNYLFILKYSIETNFGEMLFYEKLNENVMLYYWQRANMPL